MAKHYPPAEARDAMSMQETESMVANSAAPNQGRRSSPFSSDLETVATKQLTQLQLAWIRLRRHRLGMLGIGVILFMMLMAIFAPWIAPENIYDP